MYADWVAKYPISLLEDGLTEDDWEGWKLLNQELGHKIELVGDDLFVNNVKRIARGIKENVANAVLIKLNQIATLTETVAAVRMAYAADWGAMVSHRSGETVDSFIADFTVALDTSRLALPVAVNGWKNTISFCGLRNPWRNLHYSATVETFCHAQPDCRRRKENRRLFAQRTD
jgi:hypothetical protein